VLLAMGKTWQQVNEKKTGQGHCDALSNVLQGNLGSCM